MGTYNLRGIINGHLYPRLEVPNGREREKKQKAFTVVNLLPFPPSDLSSAILQLHGKLNKFSLITLSTYLMHWHSGTRAQGKFFSESDQNSLFHFLSFLGVQISQITEKLIWGKEVRRQGTCILKGKKGQVFSLQLGPFTDLCRLILSQKLTCFFVHLVSSQKSKA